MGKSSLGSVLEVAQAGGEGPGREARRVKAKPQTARVYPKRAGK